MPMPRPFLVGAGSMLDTLAEGWACFEASGPEQAGIRPGLVLTIGQLEFSFAVPWHRSQALSRWPLEGFDAGGTSWGGSLKSARTTMMTKLSKASLFMFHICRPPAPNQHQAWRELFAKRIIWG